MKHDEIVKEVKRSLEETASTERGKRVELKLSLPFMEYLSTYQYDSMQNMSMEVYERNVESPYLFSIPTQVRTCTCVDMCVHACTCVCMCLHVFTVYMCLHACTCVCMCLHTCTCV